VNGFHIKLTALASDRRKKKSLDGGGWLFRQVPNRSQKATIVEPTSNAKGNSEDVGTGNHTLGPKKSWRSHRRHGQTQSRILTRQTMDYGQHRITGLFPRERQEYVLQVVFLGRGRGANKLWRPVRFSTP